MSPEFQFCTAAYLTKISNQVVTNLSELRIGLDQASDASIFNHTFQSLEKYHFLTEGFSNDVAQWVLAGLNRPVLAEHLAGIDIRDYVSLAELRGDMRRMVSDYCDAYPRQAEVSAFEPFYFCESAEVTVPLDYIARDLTEFREGLLKLSHASLHYHFISSRLRLHLKTNDFSQWLESIGASMIAHRIDRIDIYTNTLDTIRDEMIELIDREILRQEKLQ